jgi:hypothetical protein
LIIGQPNNRIYFPLMLYYTAEIWPLQMIISNTITSIRGLELPSTWWAFGSAGICTSLKNHRFDYQKYTSRLFIILKSN